MATLSNSTKTFKLNNGKPIPAVGLGTWQASEKGAAYTAVTTALKAGYRHIDTAAAYKNEDEVGKAIRDSGIPREEIFVTTKLWCVDHQDPAAALDLSLKNLGLDYVDLYLIHWPVALNKNGNHPSFPTLPNGNRDIVFDWSFVTTYEKLQELVPTGKVKSIGVSNFSQKRLEELLKAPTTKIKPVVNQVEAHPYLTQPKLLQYCKDQDILIEAYSPLGSTGSPLTKDDTIIKIAEKNNVTPVQVLVSWALWRGTVVLPKSVTPERVISNLKVFQISDEEGQIIDNIHKTTGIKRTCTPNFSPINIFNDDE